MVHKEIQLWVVKMKCFYCIWQERERWEAQRDSELSRVLMEHLDSKAATGKNAALPTLVVS